MTDVLGEQPGETDADFPAADPARYQTLLERIRRPGNVALDVAERLPGHWTVAIAAADFLGALAMVAGLLTAYRLNVDRADIFTASVPTAKGETGSKRPAVSRVTSVAALAPARRLLDVFEISALVEPPAELWTRFQADLTTLLAEENRDEAMNDVIDRVSDAFLALEHRPTGLLPISVEVSNALDVAATRLSVRSADTPGFLFAFANALADFAINIERAEIRTVAGEAQDNFWVTDARRRPILDPQGIEELRVATTMIKQFTHLLPRSPNPGQALRQFSSLIRQMVSRPEWTKELVNLESPVVLETLADLMGVSRFLWEDFLRMQHDNLFPLVLDASTLSEARPKEKLRDELRGRLQAAAVSHAEPVDELNLFKDREMFRIDLRHIVGRSSFAEFAQELTALAEVAVEVGIQLAQAEHLPRTGPPLLANGEPCPWTVCALGKFGGSELGFGSDLELIVVYGAEGWTAGPQPIVSSEYFGRVVQSLLHTLRSRQQGIFEIDLRLRPFGRAGALASSFDGFTSYYSPSGAAEQFERLALVRLRPIAGDPELAKRVIQARDVFVYSGQPLNLNNILHLRHRQATELVARGKLNAKYSSGGLVDLEYFVQSWQIAVGATDVTLRVTNTLEAIRRLAGQGYLPPDLAQGLAETYELLRRLIDALRVVRGHAKDLTIPPEGSREAAYLARRLGFSAEGELRQAIATRMAFSRGLWTTAPPPG